MTKKSVCTLSSVIFEDMKMKSNNLLAFGKHFGFYICADNKTGSKDTEPKKTDVTFFLVYDHV